MIFILKSSTHNSGRCVRVSEQHLLNLVRWFLDICGKYFLTRGLFLFRSLTWVF